MIHPFILCRLHIAAVVTAFHNPLDTYTGMASRCLSHQVRAWYLFHPFLPFIPDEQSQSLFVAPNEGWLSSQVGFSRDILSFI